MNEVELDGVMVRVLVFKRGIVGGEGDRIA